MSNYPIVNRNYVIKNKEMKKSQKSYKRVRGKGSRKLLKNYIGKLIYLSSEVPVLDKEVPLRKSLDSLTANELISKIEDMKLCGQSGNGFLVSEKMKTLLDSKKTKRTLIINGVECEPGLLHDEWLLENRKEEILKGIKYVNDALDFQQIILAKKEDSKISNLNSTTNINVKSVPNRYPMGEEHFLIEELLKLKIGRDVVPAKEGILVLNIQTIFQIYHIINNSYENGHYITIANLATSEAKIAFIENGYSIKDLLLKSLGEGKLYYAGQGILSAHEIEEDEVFTEKISFAAIGNEYPIYDDNPCKKCGRCTRKCPSGVKVKDIVIANEQGQKIERNQYLQQQCIGCGSCTYFCKAGKNVEAIVKESRNK